MSMNKIRLRYSKTGRAKYISHLDLMATMRRAFLRAGLDMKYSEGFNPHPYMSVALPLPVGCGSVCELIDIGLIETPTPDSLPKLITDMLPEGLEVHDAYTPARKFSEITWIEMLLFLQYNEPEQDISEKLTECFMAEKIIISKRSKRGVSDINIAPFIKDIVFQHFSGSKCAESIINTESCNNLYHYFAGAEKYGTISMKAKISAQNPSINAENVMGAFKDEFSVLMPDFTAFTRLENLDAENRIFK